MSSQIVRPWSEPCELETSSALPARPAVGGPGGLAQAILKINGHYNALDVWANLPLDWIDVELELRGHVQGGIAVLDRKFVRDIDGARIVSGAGGAGTQIAGVLFSVRGRPVDRFTVVAYYRDAAIPAGDFVARAYVDGAIYGDRSTVSPVMPFSFGHQQLAPFNLDLAVGVNAVYPVPADGGRIDITDVKITSDDPALPHLVTLDWVGGPGGVRASWRLPIGGGQAGGAYSQPLRGFLGGGWALTLAGLPTPGSFVRANVVGYST